MPQISVGDIVRVKSVKSRTDGLIDTQEFHARVTSIDVQNASWVRIDTIHEENVLMRTETGGFSLRFGWDVLNQIGIFQAT